MSDLNDFFAKKDRKKKKPGKAARSGSVDSAHANSATNPSTQGEQGSLGVQQSPSTFSTSKPLKGDDGWIELDEATKATVNTGGRTVAVFKRDADDRDMNGDADCPMEKFVGWSKADAESGERTFSSALASSSSSLSLSCSSAPFLSTCVLTRHLEYCCCCFAYA
jgi:hypothetical protein